jgi:hypothetical protein
MVETNLKLEFEIKVRRWASTSLEGINVLFTKELDSNSGMVKELFNLIEYRRLLANDYFKTESDENKLSIMMIISDVNSKIKKLLAL